VFAIQSEIAKAIADQLQAKLSPSEKSAIEQRPTSDVAAFDLYSRAKTLLLNTSFSAIAGKNMLQAVDLLNQAVARDSSFFEAYGQLAIVNGNLYFLNIDHTPARLALAEGALAQAARLRPDAGETHLTRADARVFELTAYILRRQGKYEDGLRNLQRAIEIDPRNFFTLQQIALMYLTLRRYPEEIAVLDRALAIKPDDVETRATRALVMFDWKADAKPMHQAIDEIRAKNPGELAQIADSWFLITLADRDLAAAEAALAALGDNSWGDNAMQFSSLLGRALIARMTNDQSKAQAAFAAARMEQEKILQSQASYGPAVCTLGIIDAGLGHKQEALKEAQRAMELLPVAKDSLNGADLIQFSAIIAAWVGEKDLAATGKGRATSRHTQLRSFEAAALLGPAPRRSAFRKNRRLPRPEISLFVFNHAVVPRPRDEGGWHRSPRNNSDNASPARTGRNLMTIVIAATPLSRERGCMNEQLNTADQSENQHESTYALLIRSEEKSRNLIEVALYPLLSLLSLIAIWQFAQQAIG